ncbi:hypothetical protein [Pseudoalteromonas qingdaonensis]
MAKPQIPSLPEIDDSLSYYTDDGAVAVDRYCLPIFPTWLDMNNLSINHYRLEHANPSWFIPVVGNIIAPITGAKLGYIEVSWFFFSVGIVF